MWKKCLYPLTALTALICMVSTPHAADETVFGPEHLTIGKWSVHFSYHKFTAPDPGDGILTIAKKTPGRKITGGFVLFNEKFIPLSKFFKGNANVFEKQIDLRPRNRVMVFFRGQRRAAITLMVHRRAAVPVPEFVFSADPSAIAPGDPSTLTWSVSHADSITIAPDIGSVDPAGSLVVSPSETTDYTLTASGLGGTTAKSITVTVIQPMPVVEISADPPSILAGESSTLAWHSTYAETCVIEPGIGDVALNGSIAVSPGETTVYTVTAAGPGGTVTSDVTVTVTKPLPEVTIDVTPKTIESGKWVTLAWTSANVQTVTITPPPYPIGDPFFPTGPPLNGSVTMTVTESTTYISQGVNEWGSAQDSTTVTVISPEPVVTLSAIPETIQWGGSATLSWNAENSTTCSITPDIGSVPVNGSITVSPGETTHYTIIASGPGGTATTSVIVTVVYSQPTVSFTANPKQILLGDKSTLVWSTSHAEGCMIQPGIGNVASNGSIEVIPETTTAYVITAYGPGGSVDAAQIVTVATPNQLGI